MSFEANSEFFLKVSDFIDNTDGMGWIPRHATQLLENQDYEELDTFITKASADLAQTEFHSSGMFSEQTDAQ